jgi:hypothetical protein
MYYVELSEAEEDRLEELRALFKDNDVFLQFEHIKPDRRLHHRCDLNALLLLDKLVPGDKDMLCGAKHDQVYLNVILEELVKAGVTDEDILDLSRSGVFMEDDDLCMYA